MCWSGINCRPRCLPLKSVSGIAKIPKSGWNGPRRRRRLSGVLEGKWKIAIICQPFAAKGPLRFFDLERLIDVINQKMLIQQLKQLEKDGIMRPKSPLFGKRKLISVGSYRSFPPAGPPSAVRRAIGSEQ
jgi:hypothetical protein